MNVQILASTKPGYVLSKEEALDFSGRSAAICYMKGNIYDVFSQPIDKIEKRVNKTLKSGHHSVFGHASYNLYFEGISKILAIFLNNEKDYNTSEKSARFTEMETYGQEQELYNKWLNIYMEVISKKYPILLETPKGEDKLTKLAQENARYLISIFTNATNMEYTVDLRQINYIMYWAERFIEDKPDTHFNVKLKSVFKAFLSSMPDVRVDTLDTSMKGREFSTFATRERNEYFNEGYSINYLASFASFAQLHRHRTIWYEMSFLDNILYYIPPIIRETKLEKEWLADIDYCKGANYPQGMLVKVNEIGTIEGFIEKCKERICGQVQLETMQHTDETMQRYIAGVKNDERLYNQLLPYSKGPRCTFPIPGFKCDSPCLLGPSAALTRLI